MAPSAGLARGVRQLQPILTMCWSALFLADVLDPLTFVVGTAVVALVAIGRRVR
ncbi:hypothetical protein [Nonomuraea sp. NPDC003804]|uniref:hypothetical protein n=1 Tax=Nonomuraea sp. NPDC003804 TaxID=3154547 RepID=UPI0033B9C6E1